MAKRVCSSCGNGFLGRAGAAYCSSACRQRARRSRGGDKCDTKCDNAAAAVTDTAVATRAPRRKRAAGRQADSASAGAGNSGSGHSAEAVALLRKLDTELAENAKELGKPLKWSAAEHAIMELAADTIDRRGELQRLYEAAKDDKLRLKVAGELRLIEAALARLLAKIKTDLPEPPSRTSRKAQAAARTRWDRAQN